MNRLASLEVIHNEEPGAMPQKKSRCYEKITEEYGLSDKKIESIITKYLKEKELKPYQAERIKLQQYLNKSNLRMIVLFEGRGVAAKGGTIRRVTRYMNEKHYRVIAMGKATEEQRSQWFSQKYVSQFPRGGEVVLFDRSWYSRAMVEPVFGFCSPEEYKQFMRGVVGFEKDITRQVRSW